MEPTNQPITDTKQEFRDYGIEEYVPVEARHYKFIDMVSTWAGANCQPGAWFVGGSLAASGMAIAAGVTLISNPIAYIIMALVGYIGFKHSATSMGMLRYSLGIRGSQASTIFNILTLIGWGAVTSFVGAISMSYVFNSMWGWPAYGMEGSAGTMIVGTLINSVLSSLCVWIGGSKLVKIAENVAIVAMLVLSIWITVAVFRTFSFSDIIHWRPTEDVRMSLGLGIDAMFAFSISWIPCIGDYTRYTKTKAAATVAPVIGASLGMYWFALTGTVGVIAVALTTGVFDQNAADPSSVAAALGLGLPAVFIIVLSTVTTNMISIYSSTLSALNLTKKPVPFKKASYLVGGITILFALFPIAFASFLDFFYTFLDFLAMVFPAMVAVIVVDYYLLRKGNYLQPEIGNRRGPYWYTNGFNWYAIACWIFGIASYVLFKNTAPVLNAIGAVIPTFIVTGLVYYFVGRYAISKGAYRDMTMKPAKEKN